MVKIQLATGYLEVKEGTAFPLNFQVGDIRDISQRKGNFSKTITLVGSKNNNDLLNHYYDVNIEAGTFNINALTTCSVIQDGIPIMEDASLQLTSVKKVQLTDGYEEHVEYEVLVKDSKGDFFTAIGNKELTDIDFSDLNHTYDAFNVVSRFTNNVNDGFKYIMAGSGDAFYSTQEFKPAFFAKAYFDRIFSDAGFQYNWPSLYDDRFDKLVIPYNGGVDNFDYNDYVVKANVSGLTFNGTFFPGTAEMNTPLTITGWTETEDPQSIYNPLTGQYSTPFIISSNNGQYYEYTIQMQYNVILDNTTAGTIYAGMPDGAGGQIANPAHYEPRLQIFQNGVFNNGVMLYNNPNPLSPAVAYAIETPLTLAPGQTTIASQTVVVTVISTAALMSSGTLLDLRLKCLPAFYIPSGLPNAGTTWRAGSVTGAPASFVKLQIDVVSCNISITPSNNIIAIGGTLEVNDYIPKKIKQSDFIKGVFNMYNLYAEVDKSQPNLINLIHRDAYYDSGKEVDWTYKLAKDQEQSLSFLPEITSKKVILTYAPDKDSANQVYTDATNQIYGQAEVVFDNDYVKEITTKAVLFSPTPINRTPFDAYVPMIAGASPDTNIRILYDGGMRTCGPFNIYDYGSTGMSGLTSYPYCGHFDDPLQPNFDINFAVCSFYYYQALSLTDNNLYNRYWRRTMGQINNGKMLTAYFDLKEPDIQSLELNDKIRIDNSWWNINKVIDYDANANKLTQVELISIDNEINFMPFTTPWTTPGVGLPNVSTIQQAGNQTVINSKLNDNNVNGGGQVSGNVIGKGNLVSPGTKTVTVATGATVDEDGITVDNLRVLSTLNGRPVVENAPYLYTANLLQLGVAAPIPTLMEASFGNITWVYNGPGQYQGFIEQFDVGIIPQGNISVLIGSTNLNALYTAYYSLIDNSIYIETTQIGVGLADNLLNYTTLEIKYYPR
jgi:hypothetical protein